MGSEDAKRTGEVKKVQEEMRRRAVGTYREAYAEGIPDETGNIQTITLQYDGDPCFENEAIERAKDYDVVICAIVYRIIMRRGTANVRPRCEAFLRKLTTLDVPTAIVSFGAPYVIKQTPDADAFIAAYMYSPLVQTATVEAIFGEIPFKGTLSVKV